MCLVKASPLITWTLHIAYISRSQAKLKSVIYTQSCNFLYCDSLCPIIYNSVVFGMISDVPSQPSVIYGLHTKAFVLPIFQKNYNRNKIEFKYLQAYISWGGLLQFQRVGTSNFLIIFGIPTCFNFSDKKKKKNILFDLPT